MGKVAVTAKGTHTTLHHEVELPFLALWQMMRCRPLPPKQEIQIGVLWDTVYGLEYDPVAICVVHI